MNNMNCPICGNLLTKVIHVRFIEWYCKVCKKVTIEDVKEEKY